MELSAERVFINCRAYAFDAGGTVAEAIAVRNGRIVAVGRFDRLSMPGGKGVAVGPETQVVDLGGRTVVPGLIDAHAHMIEYGISSIRAADLTDCSSIRELQDRLRAFRKVNPNAPWLMGSRFDQELFEEKRWIERADLDQVSADVPIMISRLCLHAVVLNSAALRPIRTKLSADQARTGILAEDAAGPAWEMIPTPTAEEHLAAAQWALERARQVGLTGVHCIVESREDLEALRSLDARGPLPVRVQVIPLAWMLNDLLRHGLPFGSGSEFLKIGPLKMFMDGSMGTQTAAMREPFSDDPGNCGGLLRNEHELAQMLEQSQKEGFQAAIHAIGDLAVECAVKGIELAAAGRDKNPFRHRIEHCSQMSKDLIAEMARLDVVACVQPQFVITDFWTRQRVGPERYRWSYPFKSMIRQGITLAMASDCPVERLDPVELMHRAVNREPMSLEERMSVEEVIRCYSSGGAFAGFDETRLGSLEVGKLADFTVFETDPWDTPLEEIERIKVFGTAVGGLM